MYFHEQEAMLSRCISTDSEPTCGALQSYDGTYNGQAVNDTTYIKPQQGTESHYMPGQSDGYAYQGCGAYSQVTTTSLNAYAQHSQAAIPVGQQGYFDGECRPFFDPTLAVTQGYPLPFFNDTHVRYNQQEMLTRPLHPSPLATPITSPQMHPQSSLYRIAPEEHAALLVEQPVPRSTALTACISTLLEPRALSQLNHDGTPYGSPSPAYTPAVVYAERSTSQDATPSTISLVIPHHESVSPKQHSSYSELSANIEYFSHVDFSSHEHPMAQPTAPGRASTAGSPVSVGREPLVLPMRVTQQQVPVSSLLRKSPPSAGSLREADTPSASDSSDSPRQPGWTPPSKRKEKTKPRTSSTTTSLPKTAKSATKKTASGSEPKRLSLACLFCRERKIACGRPAAGSLDQRCNQCVRRSFCCEYPTESRRGQHKRIRKKESKKESGHEVSKAK